MGVSFSAVQPTNMELTPVRVKFNGADLGGTLSNCKVSISYSKADIKADQFGDDTIIDRRVRGLKISIETEIAEVVLKDHWKVVFPNMGLVGSGSKAGYFASQVGASDVALSGTLLLHPLSLPDADLTRDWTFYKATAESVSEVTYGPNTQARLKIKWMVFPDVSVVPARFAFYGDTSNGIVSASAGSPSFTGTGNGTLTSVAVFDGFGGTKTETIAVKVLGTTTGNDFSVSGLTSGPLGTFHVGATNGNSANFVSPEISFTVTQGTVQFAYNDTFSISTTASNYV